ncbi:MAG TPA: alpha/beta hydrolase fold domain-containing protein [Blastocatellia bacterium]|nr:alpha/beta hydrolase fold domain-containing protein [Blastocatellia bacterium]
MLRKPAPFSSILASLVVAIILPAVAHAQFVEGAARAGDLQNRFRIVSNITYLTANNYEAKLDVYVPRNQSGPNPTVIYIHGGGWVGGAKETSWLAILPFLEAGWSVVNVEYRLARVSLAPAAVEDCRCALRWVIRNAKEYNFDISKLVVTGHSAGGHLSLTTGMLPASAGLDRQCPGIEELKVAAIVNWFGITDVVDLLDGPNSQSYAVAWLGSMTNREEVAKRTSPLTYVRAGIPPIITIHGDADPTVPYSHAVRLHEALNKAGVPNQLVTIPGGKHGGFSHDETTRAYTAIREFLIKHGVMKASGSPSIEKTAAQAQIRFELRRAEREPAKDLVEAAVERSGERVYLHKEVLLTNSDIVEARVVEGFTLGDFSINVSFTREATERVANATAQHIGKPMAILFDGKVVSAPIVWERLSDRAQISGSFKKEEAERIANGINSK